MGSNIRHAVCGGVSAVILVLGTAGTASAGTLDGVWGHIDIPEIAGGGTWKYIPGLLDESDHLIDLSEVADQFGASFGSQPHQEASGVPGGALPPSPGNDGVIDLFRVELPDAGAPTVGLDTSSSIPSPGASLLALGAGVFGLRRRRA